MTQNKSILNSVAAGVVIALVSGYASFLFGKSTIRSQTIRDQRALAYVQLVDKRALTQRLKDTLDDYEKDPSYIEALALYNAARYRVLIFGERRVILSLAEYEKATGDDTTEAAMRLFQAMRHDLLSASERVDNRVIFEVLDHAYIPN